MAHVEVNGTHKSHKCLDFTKDLKVEFDFLYECHTNNIVARDAAQRDLRALAQTKYDYICGLPENTHFHHSPAESAMQRAVGIVVESRQVLAWSYVFTFGESGGALHHQLKALENFQQDLAMSIEAIQEQLTDLNESDFVSNKEDASTTLFKWGSSLSNSAAVLLDLAAKLREIDFDELVVDMAPSCDERLHSEVVWHWRNDGGEWVAFEELSFTQIETAYRSALPMVSVNYLGSEIIITFETMTAKNSLVETHFELWRVECLPWSCRQCSFRNLAKTSTCVGCDSNQDPSTSKPDF